MKILDKHVLRGKQTASRIWGGIAVIVTIPVDKSEPINSIFSLSPIGTFIWKQLENRPKLRAIIDCVAKKKRIRHDMAEKEIVKFIKKLAAKKIVDLLDNLD